MTVSSERMRKLHADPEFAAANSERASERMRKLNADPEFAAKRRASLEVQWTSGMDAELTRLAHLGVGIVIIAVRIGVAPQTASKRRDALGMPKGRAGRSRHDAILAA